MAVKQEGNQASIGWVVALILGGVISVLALLAIF
jgi:hypothetical protein